ncbi:unnamed protein product [Boreogadus saida]
MLVPLVVECKKADFFVSALAEHETTVSFSVLFIQRDGRLIETAPIELSSNHRGAQVIRSLQGRCTLGGNTLHFDRQSLYRWLLGRRAKRACCSSRVMLAELTQPCLLLSLARWDFSFIRHQIAENFQQSPLSPSNPGLQGLGFCSLLEVNLVFWQQGGRGCATGSDVLSKSMSRGNRLQLRIHAASTQPGPVLHPEETRDEL